MVNIENIKKKLEKIKRKKEKISFLERELKKSKNKSLEKEIKKLLLKLKDDLEERIVVEGSNNVIPKISLLRQNLDETAEEIIEEPAQPQHIDINPELIDLSGIGGSDDRYDASVKYTGDYGLSSGNYTLSSGQVSYEAITTKHFTGSPTSLSDQDKLKQSNPAMGFMEETDPFYQRFIEEGVFDQETIFSHDQKERLRDKVGGLTSNPEEAMRKESELMFEGKRTKKYITRFI